MVFPMMCVLSVFFTRRRKQKRALLVEKCGLKFPSHTKRHARNQLINFEKRAHLYILFVHTTRKTRAPLSFFVVTLVWTSRRRRRSKKKKRKEGASPVVCVFGKAHRSLAFATSFCVFDELKLLFFWTLFVTNSCLF